MEGDPENIQGNLQKTPLAVVSDKEINGVDVSSDETIFSGYTDLLQKLMSLKDSGSVKVSGQHETESLTYSGLRKEFLLSYKFTAGGLPVAIVDDALFKRLKNDKDPNLQKESSVSIGIHVKNEDHLKKANDLFAKVNKRDQHLSRLDESIAQKSLFG
nr:bacitracin ABC transporter permease [Bacillus pacificus]